MKHSEIEVNLTKLESAIMDMGLSQMAIYLKENKEMFSKTLIAAIHLVVEDVYGNEQSVQVSYNKGYSDALALLEKEGKVVIVNNYQHPFA